MYVKNSSFLFYLYKNFTILLASNEFYFNYLAYTLHIFILFIYVYFITFFICYSYIITRFINLVSCIISLIFKISVNIIKICIYSIFMSTINIPIILSSKLHLINYYEIISILIITSTLIPILNIFLYSFFLQDIFFNYYAYIYMLYSCQIIVVITFCKILRIHHKNNTLDLHDTYNKNEILFLIFKNHVRLFVVIILTTIYHTFVLMTMYILIKKGVLLKYFNNILVNISNSSSKSTLDMFILKILTPNVLFFLNYDILISKVLKNYLIHVIFVSLDINKFSIMLGVCNFILMKPQNKIFTLNIKIFCFALLLNLFSVILIFINT